MNTVDLVEKLSGTWAGAGILFIFICLLGAMVHLLFKRWVMRLTANTKTHWDDAMAGIVQPCIFSYALVAAVALAVRASPAADHWSHVTDRMALAFVVVLMTVGVLRSMKRVLQLFIGLRGRDMSKEGSVALTVSRILVAFLGVLMLLNTLGIRIGPLLGALGIGGLAMALALQDTLGNLFSGMYINISQNIHVGDYIRLDSGEEGYIRDISWRATKIWTIDNNLILVPNSRLAGAIITNFSNPETTMALRLEFGVGYDSDPDHVSRILVEETLKVAESEPGLLIDPEPKVRFMPGFMDSSLNFTLICHIDEFMHQYQVQDAIRRRVLLRFRAEGVDIPFPIVTLNVPADMHIKKSR